MDTRNHKTLVVIAALVAGSALHGQNRAVNEDARAARLANARAQLAALLSGEGALGRFVERIPGSYAFSPQRADLPPATVVNPANVSSLAVGPVLTVRGTLDGRGLLTVAEYSLGTRAWASGASDTPSLPAQVGVASRTLFGTLEAALKPGVMSVGTRAMSDPSALTQQTLKSLADIRAAYAQAVLTGAPEATITAIVRRWAELRTDVTAVFSDSPDSKALYGPPDNYDPWRYDVIYRQSRAVVAIGDPGASAARCSGALIASDLVLTAAHCFGGQQPRLPKELEVWFDFARGPNGSNLSVQRRPIVELVTPSPARLKDILAGAFDSQLLDYAIVRLGKPVAPATALPQCLRDRPLDRGDPVYVVGYPRGEPIMVHDSARVYLPYRIMDGPTFFRLRLDIDADLLDSPNRDEFMKEFDLSYEIINDVSGVTYRYFHHIKDGGQPRMGIVADTFRGNSGGPVYDRERGQCVVGILIAGADDTGARLTANWKQHERVLPIRAILEDADRMDPNLRKRLRLE
jgi:V8-like Glu-specific endopeptidase